MEGYNPGLTASIQTTWLCLINMFTDVFISGALRPYIQLNYKVVSFTIQRLLVSCHLKIYIFEFNFIYILISSVIIYGFFLACFGPLSTFTDAWLSQWNKAGIPDTVYVWNPLLRWGQLRPGIGMEGYNTGLTASMQTTWLSLINTFTATFLALGCTPGIFWCRSSWFCFFLVLYLRFWNHIFTWNSK